MEKVSLTSVTKAMNAAGITPEKQAVVMDLLQPRTRTGKDWKGLLDTLARDRRSMVTNMHNRSEALRPLYAEYVAIMDKVLERIQIAATNGTPADAARAAALVNEQRAAEGRRPIYSDGPHWQTWVSPHIRQAFAAKVTQAYDTMGYKRGNRFIPFVPLDVRKDVDIRVGWHREMFARMRRDHEYMPNTGKGNTPYRALMLCATRMAERQLDNLVLSYKVSTANILENVLPVNWLALLDAPMRARVRAAQRNPAGVDLEGLSQFYDPTPEEVRVDFDVEDARYVTQNPLDENGLED